MIPYLSARENAVEHIHTICLRLFDSWCENRNVIPLAYLMHCWPLINSGPISIRRLADTMWELRKFHAETLDVDESGVLCDLADCIDEILGNSFGPFNLAANG